jgi:serralysin
MVHGTPESETINGTPGNDHIDGHGGEDAMHGGAGDDTYVVDSYGDTVHELPNQGNDTVLSSVSHILDDNVENVTLVGSGSLFADGNSLDNRIIGNDGDNVLSGLAGNDYLDGGAGADEMFGGIGNDTYVVDDYGDRVVERVNEGSDRVLSSKSYVLGANVEDVTLTGAAENFADGNALDNYIAGNSAANVLTGGAGHDVFAFSTALGNGNVDTIADFDVADDTIYLDNGFFVGVGADGGFASTAFAFGASAGDGDDRIIYDRDTGALYFDADGSGSGEEVQFAWLDTHLQLTDKDFFVV